MAVSSCLAEGAVLLLQSLFCSEVTLQKGMLWGCWELYSQPLEHEAPTWQQCLALQSPEPLPATSCCWDGLGSNKSLSISAPWGRGGMKHRWKALIHGSRLVCVWVSSLWGPGNAPFLLTSSMTKDFSSVLFFFLALPPPGAFYSHPALSACQILRDSEI